MPPEVFHEFNLVRCKVVWVVWVIAPLDLVVVVVKCLSFDVLVLSGDHSMSDVEVHSSLFVGERLHVAIDLVVIVAMTYGAPPEYHIEDLFHCSGTLILEQIIGRNGNLSLSNLKWSDNRKLIVKLDYVASAVLQPEEQACLNLLTVAFSLLSNDEIFLKDQRLLGRLFGKIVFA